MHFPTADLTVNPLIPPLVAFAISFFTSTGGVSGAFLLLPFQMSVLGFTSPAVSATNQLYNVVAIPSGVYRYFREGRMVWPLTWVVVAGSLPGVLIGAVLRIRYLPDPRNFKFFVGLVLLYLGARVLGDVMRRRPGVATADEPVTEVVVERFGPTRIAYVFRGERFTVNTLALAALSLAVGVVGGVYGIGGGAIIAPVLVSVWGLPVYTVAGAALMGTFVTSAGAVLFYGLLASRYPELAVSPDWLLGLLFGLGGFAGIYCGARLQKRFPATVIKWILAACILFVSIRYIVDFFS
ncbi:sulfite exporter TauE/SafE family protein [bacterium]|nr:sulfite exporter TauE/SafE family protein [bacterium]MBU1073848.1 sulfite exporter TauE/SafE family protein [bacterium]MBU1674496.1 sulfite exporter TauE/SafE family protein [bacterium]